MLLIIKCICRDGGSNRSDPPATSVVAAADGTVRLFRENGHDGLSYLTAYQTKYVPIGQEIELTLGPDPQVVHERLRLRSWRDNFWFQTHRPKVYFSPAQGHRIHPNYTVAGWDDHERGVSPEHCGTSSEP